MSSTPTSTAGATSTNASTTTTTTTTPCCHKDSCDLLTWKDPIKTGKLFGTIIITLVVLKTVNVFNLLFHVAYIGLIGAAVVEYSTKLVTGKGLVSTYKPACQSCAEKFNQQVLPHLSAANIKAEQRLKSIVFAENPEHTLKAAGVSYILYKLTSWFSIFTLITMATVLLFTLPFIYTNYKKEIDAAIANFSQCAKSKIAELRETAERNACPHIQNLLKKAGPVGEFIQSKLHTRTAGSTVNDSKDSVFSTGAAPASTTTTTTTTTDAAAQQESIDDSTATTTGASQFPNVPSSDIKSAVEEIQEEAQSLQQENAKAQEEADKLL